MRYILEFCALGLVMVFSACGLLAAGWAGAANAFLVVGLVVALGLNWKC